jgi:PAS domain S-box-containing protein
MNVSHDNRPLILIVDDTPANLGVLVDLLSAHELAVSVAEDGDSALEQIEFVMPDLVLLDVLMPNLDGYATCEQLKARPATRDIPVIFMTGLTDAVNKVKGFELGAVDYITKPFQHEEVLARINMHLTLQQLRRRLQESEQRLSRVVESAMDAIVTLDQDGRIIFFNRAAERAFRCSSSEAIGEPCARFLSAPLRRMIFENEEAAPPPAMWVPEGHHAVRADGELFAIEASLSRAEAGGRTIHTLILRDMDERNKQRLRELGARMQHDIEEERKRISQSLHDEMGQNLTALQLDADWIRRHCQSLPSILDTVDRMQRSIEESAASMRRIVADMRPRVLDDLGIDVAIKGLVQDVSTRSGLTVKFSSKGKLDHIDDARKTALFRMLQECLTNVTRHAHASRVDIFLLASESDIQLSVADDGRGFSPQAHFKPGSFGLFGLGERAGQLSGTVAVESAPGKGTRVVIRLPLPASAVESESPLLAGLKLRRNRRESGLVQGDMNA